MRKNGRILVFLVLLFCPFAHAEAPLSGPILPFSGMYLATGTGWTRSSTNNAGWLKDQDKAQIAQKVDLMTFFLMLGMGRTFGGGLYIGIDVAMNVAPKAHKEQEKTSAHGATIEVMGPSKVSCSMAARFGYVPKDTACLLFLMIGA
ncbi:MAG: hypothetical protein LBF76_00730, partial [Holosporales bacterium]|nr:hypothetical protein [Holosporales bacterium]